MRKYLRSTMSNGESIFLTEGRAVIGEPNHITTLIKFIGKYDTLCNEDTRGKLNVGYIIL